MVQAIFYASRNLDFEAHFRNVEGDLLQTTYTYTERLFIWEINKDELVFNIFLYENREKRGFVIFMDIIESMFNIGITIFNNLSEKLVFNIRNISNAF